MKVVFGGGLLVAGGIPVVCFLEQAYRIYMKKVCMCEGIM